MKEIIIDSKLDKQRLDRVLERFLKNASKSFIYKMLRKKNITLNDKKASGNEKLNVGDSIKIFFSDETLSKFTGNESITDNSLADFYQSIYTPLDIVFENNDYIFINKPAGMLSQKAKPEDVSLVEYLIAHLLRSNELSVEDLVSFKPGICNRLDRNTSGIVCAGKTTKGLARLSSKFKERTLNKYYICMVFGEISERKLIKGYLNKDCEANKVEIITDSREGYLPIETEYIPVCGNDKITFLKVHLITGRSHQIRAHLASINHPLIGDYKYGNSKLNNVFKNKYNIQNQMLHAFELDIPDEALHIYTKIPYEFMNLLEGEGLCQPGIQEDLEVLH